MEINLDKWSDGTDTWDTGTGPWSQVFRQKMVLLLAGQLQVPYQLSISRFDSGQGGVQPHAHEGRSGCGGDGGGVGSG